MQKLEIASKSWSVENKTELLRALISELGGDARISFEGNLRDLRILSLPGVSRDETAVLKRKRFGRSKILPSYG